MQGNNGQIAVDAAHQIIVAHLLVTNAADARVLVPLVDDVQTHLGRKPREVSGDAGFANEANLAALKERGIAGYLAQGRARQGEPDATGRRHVAKKPLMSAMAARLKRAGSALPIATRDGTITGRAQGCVTVTSKNKANTRRPYNTSYKIQAHHRSWSFEQVGMSGPR